MTQFAITLGVFLLLAFGLIEFSLTLYRSSALQEALSMTARSAVVGYGNAAPDKVDAIKKLTWSNARNLGLTIDLKKIRICPASVPNCAVEGTGSSGDFFVIQAELEPDMIFRNHLSYTASVTMRNE